MLRVTLWHVLNPEWQTEAPFLGAQRRGVSEALLGEKGDSHSQPLLSFTKSLCWVHSCTFSQFFQHS